MASMLILYKVISAHPMSYQQGKSLFMSIIKMQEVVGLGMLKVC